jgi:hypothetical protein
LYPWDLEDLAHPSSEKDLESGTTSSADNSCEPFNWDSVSADKPSTFPGSPTNSKPNIRKTRKSKIFEIEVPVEDEYVKKVQRARYLRTWVVATAVAAMFIAVFLGVPNLPR